MNLIETPQSIVPGQSEIDCWPQLKRAMHPCQDKCSNFKDEECGHCLVKPNITAHTLKRRGMRHDSRS